MRSLLCVLAAAALTVLPAVSARADDDGSPSSFTLRDPRITESSGLAASRAHPGVYWTHNDSDDGPYVYAVDSRTGETVATVTMRGVGTVRDVEAVSVGADGNVYVGDIGDNLGGTWPKVWIYRFPEPARLRDVTVDATQFTVRYQGGPRDAEALMVHPVTGRVYIASKSKRDGGLYEGPARLSATGVNVFRRIAGLGDLWVTDGAFSPDGTRLALRSYFSARMYRWRGGRPVEDGRLGVPIERQGESVTFTPDGRTLLYGTEGAGSEVTPRELSGDQLPESAAKSGGADGAGGGRGGHADGSTTSDADRDHHLLVGAGTFAVAVVLWLGLRRLLRRADRPGPPR